MAGCNNVAYLTRRQQFSQWRNVIQTGFSKEEG